MRRYLLSLFLFALPAPSLGAELLPDRLLFKPLIADPRWPRFEASMMRVHNGEHKTLAGADFGGSFALIGDEKWQFGVQAGVFSIWDMSTETDEMVNADFVVGFPYARKWGRLTAAARLFHVSTHLGDEYVLSHPWVERVNLSYEAIDVRASWDFDGGFRAYGGGGYLYRRYPSDLKAGVLQLGGEWERPEALFRGLKPFAGLDLQKREDNKWSVTDVSVRVGLLAERRARRFSVFADYYRGHNPNGQWFRTRFEKMGLGAQLTF